jgi:hypothetical protein
MSGQHISPIVKEQEIQKESTAQLQLTDTVFFFGGLVHHLII